MEEERSFCGLNDFDSRGPSKAIKLYQYSFGDQLRRAGLSVPNNIAEGNGRRSKKESSNFYNISKGSVYECVNILVILNNRKLIDWEKFDREVIYKLAEEIAKMLSGLIKSGL